MQVAILGMLLVLCAGCSSVSPLTAEGPSRSTAAGRVARVQSLVAAFNRHDRAASVAHLAAAATWNRGDGSSLSGREALAEQLQRFFVAFPDAALTATRLLAVEPDAVVVEWLLEGTHLGSWQLPGPQTPRPPTGRALRVVGADLLRFDRAGEIESDEARIDAATLLAQIGAAAPPPPAPAALRDFAARYTAAWGSQDAARVASFYAPNGSLSINGQVPAVGRAALAEAAQGFMTAFPDMQLAMDALLVQGDRAVFQWTLVGTNSGPGGTGQRVRFSGFEVWEFSADGLIARSRGHFDSFAYQEQLAHGVGGARK